MRSLFVSCPGSPLPIESGWAIRYWNQLVALRSLGEVDVWLLDEPDGWRAELLSRELGDQRVHADTSPFKEWTRGSDLRWLLASRNPKWPPLVEGVRRQFQEWIAPAYDVILFSHESCYGYFGDLVSGPVIVDLDDVPDRTLARALRLEVRLAGARALLPHTAYRLLLNAVNVHRFRRLQAGLAASGVWRFTCSESDRARLGTDRVMVVPNGYERSGSPVGKEGVSSPPTILMTGSLQYPPNADAVGYFVHDILPKIRRLQPDVRVAVVGSTDHDSARALAGCEGVDLLGHVARIEDVLARTDLVVAPFRLGGGTRIKILEAFAHRVPVVSTTIGAEGLAVLSGRELLIADTADAFAQACLRVLDDRQLRARLVANAQDLVEREYSWPKIRAELATFLEREFAPTGSV